MRPRPTAVHSGGAPSALRGAPSQPPPGSPGQKPPEQADAAPGGPRRGGGECRPGGGDHTGPCGRATLPGDPCARRRVATQRDRDRVPREWEAVRDAAVTAATAQEAPQEEPAPFGAAISAPGRRVAPGRRSPPSGRHRRSRARSGRSVSGATRRPPAPNLAPPFHLTAPAARPVVSSPHHRRSQRRVPGPHHGLRLSEAAARSGRPSTSPAPPRAGATRTVSPRRR